jgi:hypothetical protein
METHPNNTQELTKRHPCSKIVPLLIGATLPKEKTFKDAHEDRSHREEREVDQVSEACGQRRPIHQGPTCAGSRICC